MKFPLEQILKFETIQYLHDNIIRRTGGLEGIKDKGGILSALANPFHTFAGKELYPTIIEKIGIIFFSLIKNHGFTDGNKRTACLVLDMVLYNYNIFLNANDEKMEEVAIRIAENKFSKEETFNWIYKNIRRIEEK
ncbi:MAG: type II toxin-antitoxin system death-on-curing family toxin [Candidatus Omnitrophota bacterium]|nr:MAG: type II toxin-antitoxin system death-on-curing family toxin [Candidatus Omnitrophota bacterium]